MGQRQQPSDNKKRWDWSWSSGIGIVVLVFVLLSGTSAWAISYNDHDDFPGMPPGPNKDLMLATAHCDLANIRQALANGADINHYDNGFTPLYYAVSNAAAISHGVHLNVTIFNDPMECVKYLLDHGANPNARYGDQPTDSPLSIAGSWEDIALTKILLAHGAIPTQHDIDRSRGISKVLMERAVLGP